GNYSGSYYVTETHHLFHERKYITQFSVRGLRSSGDIVSILSAKPHLEPGQTMLVGIVSNNNDPKGWGRVRVKFPTLTEEHESNWARVVSVGAGPTRGFDCLPEINDEVLVAFEHGDIHRPYVIGGVWNGTDAPPEAVAETIVGGKVRLRTFKTRVGHKLQFVEEDKTTKKGVYLNTIGGHNLRLNDSDKFVELETTGGHKFRADDSSKEVSLTSTGDITVKTGTSGSTKDLTINAANISLIATTNITLKVGSNKIVISNSGIDIEGIKVQIKASATVNVEATATNTIKGTVVNVDGSGMAVIKGGLVKIN
ncbi:MAG: phage baseplate assembly protein V, partial [Pseudanabaena sp.]